MKFGTVHLESGLVLLVRDLRLLEHGVYLQAGGTVMRKREVPVSGVEQAVVVRGQDGSLIWVGRSVLTFAPEPHRGEYVHLDISLQQEKLH